MCYWESTRLWICLFADLSYQVLFPMIPQICDIDRLKAGGEHWQWDPNVPFYLGVLPRRGAKGTDVKVKTIPLSSPCSESES